jgi:hypothetical protein
MDDLSTKYEVGSTKLVRRSPVIRLFFRAWQIKKEVASWKYEVFAIGYLPKIAVVVLTGAK